MQAKSPRLLAIAIMAGVGVAVDNPSAQAQAPGSGLSLGGYGAMAGAPGSSLGTSFYGIDSTAMGAGLLPYAGRFGTAMPSQMGGLTGLTFRSRPSAMLGRARPLFTMGPMGGMSAMAGGMGPAQRPFVLPDLGVSGGMGLGIPRWPMPRAGGMGVMPPSLGYPFRQPPIPGAPSTGPSMSM
jgi:hypothetical protein